MARHRSPRSPRRGRGACRSAHTFGRAQLIGAGIVRYVCTACGSVSIDITRVDVPAATGSLFEASEGTLERT